MTSHQMYLAQHCSYFIIFSPSHFRFHVIPYKDNKCLNHSTKVVTNKPRIFYSQYGLLAGWVEYLTFK